jgi:hypothetical protein
LSFDHDIAGVRARIVKAQADRDAGQASGSQRKYLSACLDLRALGAELDRLREQRVRSTASCRRS